MYHHNPTYGKAEPEYADAITGGSRQLDAVEASWDYHSRVLLTSPACGGDDVFQRGLGLLPATGLEPAILKKGY
jgi:hypothetical protein